MPPVPIGVSNGASAVGVFYVQQVDQSPNAFAAFWHNFHQVRSPIATELFFRRLDAMDPAAQNGQLAALQDLKNDLVTKNQKHQVELEKAKADFRLGLLQEINKRMGSMEDYAADQAATRQRDIANRRSTETEEAVAGVVKGTTEVAIEDSMKAVSDVLRRANASEDLQERVKLLDEARDKISSLEAKARSSGARSHELHTIGRRISTMVAPFDENLQRTVEQTIKARFEKPVEAPERPSEFGGSGEGMAELSATFSRLAAGLEAAGVIGGGTVATQRGTRGAGPSEFAGPGGSGSVDPAIQREIDRINAEMDRVRQQKPAIGNIGDPIFTRPSRLERTVRSIAKRPNATEIFVSAAEGAAPGAGAREAVRRQRLADIAGLERAPASRREQEAAGLQRSGRTFAPVTIGSPKALRDARADTLELTTEEIENAPFDVLEANDAIALERLRRRRR